LQETVVHSTTLAHRSAGSGSLVVCLHSSAGSSGQWQALLAAGQDRHRFVAPDFHGHGRSPQPPADRDYSLSLETDAVVRLLRGVDHVDLVGHSYGAVVALDIARRMPAQVRSLTIYEPVLFGILDHGSTAYREVTGVGQAIVADARGGREEAAAARFMDYWAGGGSWAAMGELQRRTVVARIAIVASHFEALFANPIPLRSVAELHVPVLLMQGGRTTASAAAVADQLAGVLPSVEVRRFEQAGHLGPITHAAEVNAAIEDHLERQRALLERFRAAA
jgi:pimeloyl-ACP methyl ester carboxylesterase